MLLLDDSNPSLEQLEGDSYAQFRDQTRFWIQRVAVPLLMVIGLFGNSITVIIMTRRRMRSTTNMYLAALAFVDMLYLVLTFLLGLSHYPNMEGSEYLIYWKCRPFLMMLTDACSNTSVWLTVTFTIERFIAVKYPMKGKVWCTEARAKMLIVFVFMFGVLFATPVPFEWRVVEKRIPNESFTINIPSSTKGIYTDAAAGPIDSTQTTQSELAKDTNEKLKMRNNMKVDFLSSYPYKTVLSLDYSEFGSNETFKTIYYGSTAVFFYFIPLFSLMLFNGFLIKSVHQSQRERTKMVRPSVSSTHCSHAKLDTGIELSGEGAGAGDNRPLPPNTIKTSTTRYVSNEAKSSLSTSFRLPNKSLKKQRNSMKLEPCTTSSLSNSNPSKEIKVNNCLCNSISRRAPIAPAEDTPIFNLDLLTDISPDSSGNSLVAKHCVPNNCDNVLESRQKEMHLIMKDDEETGFKKSRIGDHHLPIKRELEDKTLLGDPYVSHSIKQTLSLKRSLQTNSSTRSIIHPTCMAPVSSQERRITIMLIAVVILFLVCQIPSAAMLLYTSVHELEPNSKEEALVLAFGNIFNFLMAVNAAGDFILYSFLSKKYRKTFMILFCSCMKSQNNGNKQSHYDTRRSIRFDSSSQQVVKKCSNSLQNRRSSDKSQRDTPL